MIAQQWRQFGIDASTSVAEGTLVQRRGAGDFEVIMTWSVETWGGHPDLSFFMDSWHSQFVSALVRYNLKELATLVTSRTR